VLWDHRELQVLKVLKDPRVQREIQELKVLQEPQVHKGVEVQQVQ
jgi:hypothetical protein